MYFCTEIVTHITVTHITVFWDKKGNHEIDIILVNEQEHLLRTGEIKRQTKHIDLRAFEEKASYFISLHPHLQSYTHELLSLSMVDM